MWFGGKEYNVFYLLCLWIYFHYISRKRISWIAFIAYDKLGLFYNKLDNLIIDGRIIKIPSQKKEKQYRANDIIVDDRQHKDTRKYYRKYQIPYFASLKFFSVINQYAHKPYKEDKNWKYCTMLKQFFKSK